VIARLTADWEFVHVIARYRFPKASLCMPVFVYGVVWSNLVRQLYAVKEVRQFQKIVADYLDDNVQQTTDGFTISGLDRLDPDTPYIFVSNHRDIVLDPALLNYALFREGWETARIAVGDNLLGRAFVADLMRLNKSFVVKRTVTGAKQMLKAYLQLSEYIRHSLVSGQSIWIAQREGRAKDGLDQTDAKIIKMLYMSWRKRSASFAEMMDQVKIVPVAISYEYDPCDLMKAKEICRKRLNGSFDKPPNHDLLSIAKGISGQKGKVHLACGKPLEGNFVSPEQVAAEIDAQIIDNYRLFPTNYVAFSMLKQTEDRLTSWPREVWQMIKEESGRTKVSWDSIFSTQKEAFSKRLAEYPAKYRKQILEMYANPLISKYDVDLKDKAFDTAHMRAQDSAFTYHF
jgi:1-acyl-sn-glycerol-3-phosphate acyltransferase